MHRILPSSGAHAARRSITPQAAQHVRAAGVWLLACFAAAGCGKSADAVASLRLAAPLGLGGVDVQYAHVDVRQGEDSTRLVLSSEASSDGVIELTVRSGEPVELAATIFVFAPGEWRSFAGTSVLTPEPGVNDVELALAREQALTGSVVGVFAGPDGEVLPSSLNVALELADLDTGFVQPAAFHTGEALSLPSGRPFSLRAVSPLTGAPIELTVMSDDEFGDATELLLGDKPALELPAEPIAALTHFVFPSQPGLTTQCALGADCGDGAAWGSCTDGALDLSTERLYSIAVRFAEVPAVCDVLEVAKDLNAPLVTVSFSPPYIDAATFGAQQFYATFGADEPLDPGSLSLTWLDDTGGGNRLSQCTAVSGAALRCALDLSGWAHGSFPDDLMRFAVAAADAWGNTFQSVAALRSVSSPAGLAVLGVTTFPAKVDPRTYSFLVAIDVASFYTGGDVCNVVASSVTLDDGVSGPIDLGASAAVQIPRALSASQPQIERLWIRAHLNESTPSGTYRVEVGSVIWEDCLDPATPLGPVSGAGEITVARQPLRWLGAGPIALSSLSQHANEVDDYPLVGYSRYGLDVQSGDPRIVSVNPGIEGEGVPRLAAVRPGRARLTASDVASGDRAEIDVEVFPPSEIVAVQDDLLMRQTTAGLVTEPLAPEIGAARRVLWESSRDAIVVAGEKGVQLFGAGGIAPIVAPCNAADILDAAITAAAPGHQRQQPDVALLVVDGSGTARYCELDPGSGQVVLDVALPASECPAPSLLLANHVSGGLLALGTSCAAAFDRVPEGLSLRASAKGASFLGTPIRAVLDAPSGYAMVMVEDDVGVRSVGGWFVDGSTLVPSAAPYSLQANGSNWPIDPSAMAVDPMTGDALVVGASWSSWEYSILDLSDRRSGSPLFDWRRQALDGDGPQGFADFEHVLVDGANGLLHMARRPSRLGGAALVSFRLDDLSPWYSLSWDDAEVEARPWPNGVAALDMILAGPQPVGMSPSVAPPGGVVTIFGRGFAGDGADRVYVHGLPAAVLGSSTTSITFVVPQALTALAAWRLDVADVPVMVVSHGRSARLVRGGEGPWLRVDAGLPHKHSSFDSWLSEETCPGGSTACQEPALAVAAWGLYPMVAVRPVEQTYGVTGPEDPFTASTIHAQGVSGPIAAPGRPRILGHVVDALVDARLVSLGYVSGDEPVEPARRVALPSGFVPSGATALSPDTRVLAVAAGTEAALFWTTELSPHPAGRLGSAVPGASTLSLASGATGTGPQAIDHLLFTHGGAVIAASSGGELQAFAIKGGASGLPLTLDTSLCAPAGAPQVVSMTGATASAAGLLLVHHADVAAPMLGLYELIDDGGGITVRCRSAAPAAAQPPVSAAIAPSGLYVALVEDPAAEQSRLLDARDLRRKLGSFYVGDGSNGSLAFTRDGGAVCHMVGTSIYHYGDAL